MRGIIVFVKNPELGKVKTRLAATLGDDKALEIYNRLVDYTRELLIKLQDVKKHVFYSSFIDLEDDWSNDHFEKHLQVNGGLGEKITSALETTFDTCSPIIIIGSDCPQLTVEHVQSAFEKLKNNNIVIGPSLDGGYYLLAMDNYYPQLFEDISWSTDVVYQQTIQQAKSLDLNIAELEALSDIDYEEDWKKYGFKKN